MYQPADNRYERMSYRRVGSSGLQLPAISLGLWQNFGTTANAQVCRNLILDAFDHGIVHFDLANNYGPPPGAAETFFGQLMQNTLRPWRDELVIATKAGYDMWPGPYGIGGSRKYLLASLDQSLQRLGLPYVDIFYSHRPDPATPVAETMLALDTAVRSGRALYAGISNYKPAEATEAISIAHSLNLPLIIHQPKYSLLERWVEDGLTDLLQKEGLGMIAFSPLAQGLLTDKYLDGIPAGSRAANAHSSLQARLLTPQLLAQLQQLQIVAQHRGQSLAQMAIAWLLHRGVSSVLIGASAVSQLQHNLQAIHQTEFSAAEIADIEKILNN